MNEKISIVKRYYQSWANQDKKKALDCLSSDTFTFSSRSERLTQIGHLRTIKIIMLMMVIITSQYWCYSS